ncbi:glycosyltransferase family 4 protein [Propionivibrio sp.]|uniref:glycosyltransferase family 4 protein n=1 Tax=Propionivibrio sp. TaxID=2212460 RepID=UPI003BF2FC91
MKILYHHRTASKDGQAVHIEEMITALRGLGHEVKVIAPASGDDETLGAEVGWVQRLKRILPKALYELLELAYSFVAYFRLQRAASEFAPDIIYERYNLFLIAGVMLKYRLSIPLLLEVNSPLALERGQFGGLGMPWLARWVEGIVWRNANFVLPVTRVLADHVAARGVPESRIAVITNGINEAHFARAPSSADAKEALACSGDLVLGFTGFVRDWHGVDRVICWMATKDAPLNARLLIVGDGPARLDLEQLASSLALGERVKFTGILPRSSVPEYVAAFDIALQPAVVPYASPLKLFEYLALGKAVVAPRQPNIEEVLTDGENALLFDATATGALEIALTRLCANEALRAQIAAGAASTISRNGLTWDANAQRVTVLAKQSINSGMHPRPALRSTRP